jgi:[ribosomal protein S5]-alanine N-acetyltransferase
VIAGPIRLVPTDPSHVGVYLELRADETGRRYNPFAPATEETLRERFARAGSDLAELGKHEQFLWVVLLDGEPAGTLSLMNVNLMMRTAEIGYDVRPALRGRGIAQRAVRELVRRVFAETDLRKLVALVHEGNQASRHVLEKLGFRQEGLLREHFLIEGKPVNQVMYGLLRGELVGLPD